jgi:photosystem II stability/assembly factor-like uncharacterized protein
MPYVVRTNDSGGTWMAEDLPSTEGSAVNAVTAVDEDHVWVVGDASTILRYAP